MPGKLTGMIKTVGLVGLLSLLASCATIPTVTPAPTVAIPTAEPIQPSSTPPLAVTPTAAVALPASTLPPLTPTAVRGGLYNFHYTPDGNLIISADQLLELYDPAEQQVKWSLPESGCCDEVTMAGGRLAAVTGRGEG